MPMKIHVTLIIRTLMRWLALLVLKLTGWKAEGQKPELPKYVIIAAPHTSNWDFVYIVCLSFVYRIKPRIMVKNTWFFWPLGPVFRWLGAVPIDRSRSTKVVGQSIEAFQQQEELILAVAPSGTRKKVSNWKTGFYHIANGANVPMVLGFLDYRRKRGGFGPTIQPSGDIHGDMAKISNFYQDITGRHPKKKSPVLVDSKAL